MERGPQLGVGEDKALPPATLGQEDEGLARTEGAVLGSEAVGDRIQARRDRVVTLVLPRHVPVQPALAEQRRAHMHACRRAVAGAARVRAKRLQQEQAALVLGLFGGQMLREWRAAPELLLVGLPIMRAFVVQEEGGRLWHLACPEYGRVLWERPEGRDMLLHG